jgi:hypothetical protein
MDEISVIIKVSTLFFKLKVKLEAMLIEFGNPFNAYSSYQSGKIYLELYYKTLQICNLLGKLTNFILS